VIFDAAADGKHVLTAMLVVALLFLAVIALGEFVRASNHRRRARRPRPY